MIARELGGTGIDVRALVGRRAAGRRRLRCGATRLGHRVVGCRRALASTASALRSGASCPRLRRHRRRRSVASVGRLRASARRRRVRPLARSVGFAAAIAGARRVGCPSRPPTISALTGCGRPSSRRGRCRDRALPDAAISCRHRRRSHRRDTAPTQQRADDRELHARSVIPRRKDDERRLVESSLAEKGGPRHPLFPLPLLPSGPGGVHSFRVTRDHKMASRKSCWRRERDSNPRYLSVHTISNRAPSATRSSLHGNRELVVEIGGGGGI